MERAQYNWFLMRSRHILKSSNFQDLADSWEEKAFAEDAAAARSIGGCVWPPRSYSCSFCRREFRSAQALGGHMNVHRRDRAKLKQSLIDTTNMNPLNNDSLEPQNISTTGSPSRVSATLSGTIPQENPTHHRHLGFQLICPVVGSHDSPSGSDSGAKGFVQNISDSSMDNNNNRVETDLSMGLNSVFGQNNPVTGSCCDDDHDHDHDDTMMMMMMGYKRHKKSMSNSSSSSSSARTRWDPPLLKSSELDLELRLGVAVPAKVK